MESNVYGTEIPRDHAFRSKRLVDIQAMGDDAGLRLAALELQSTAEAYSYGYQQEWCGVPVIRLPDDIVIFQEIVWHCRPRFIVETGIARGGSLQLSASLLALLDLADFLNNDGQGKTLPKRKVVGIDVEIRSHAYAAIENSFLKPWIDMIECDSTDATLIPKLQKLTENYEKVMVILDSNHSRALVSQDLKLYSEFVTTESYLIVFDTVIAFLDVQLPGRTWGPGNSPLEAVEDFLLENPLFEIDHSLSSKLGISCAPNGFLKKN